MASKIAWERVIRGHLARVCCAKPGSSGGGARGSRRWTLVASRPGRAIGDYAGHGANGLTGPREWVERRAGGRLPHVVQSGRDDGLGSWLAGSVFAVRAEHRCGQVGDHSPGSIRQVLQAGLVPALPADSMLRGRAVQTARREKRPDQLQVAG